MSSCPPSLSLSFSPRFSPPPLSFSSLPRLPRPFPCSTAAKKEASNRAEHYARKLEKGWDPTDASDTDHGPKRGPERYSMRRTDEIGRKQKEATNSEQQVREAQKRIAQHHADQLAMPRKAAKLREKYPEREHPDDDDLAASGCETEEENGDDDSQDEVDETVTRPWPNTQHSQQHRRERGRGRGASTQQTRGQELGRAAATRGVGERGRGRGRTVSASAGRGRGVARKISVPPKENRPRPVPVEHNLSGGWTDKCKSLFRQPLRPPRPY